MPIDPLLLNTFLGQNQPPVAAGNIVQPQVAPIVPPAAVIPPAPVTPAIPQGVPAPEGAGSFFNPTKQQGLQFAGILAELAKGYDQQIGGSGAFAGAVGNLVQRDLLADQPKGPKFTPKGVKGLTSRTEKTGADGVKTITEVLDERDAIPQTPGIPPAGQPAGTSAEAAFSGGAPAPLAPSTEPDYSGLSVENQFKLAALQNDPVTTVRADETGQQFGVTKSGNVIPLGKGTQAKAAKATTPQREVVTIQGPDGPQEIVIDKLTGAQVGEAFAGVPKAKPAGTSTTPKALNPLEIEKRLQDLANVRDKKGKLIGGTQLQSNINAANADLKKGGYDYRYERFAIPEGQQLVGKNTDAVNLVITTPIDDKGNPQDVKFSTLVSKLEEDHGLTRDAALERASLYAVSKGLLAGERLKNARDKWDTVDNLATKMQKRKKK